MMTQTDIREAHRQLQLDLNQKTREEWIEDCRRRINELIEQRRAMCETRITTDDIWTVVSDPPPHVDKRNIAAALRGLRWLGYAKSTRRSRHYGTISVYEI